MTAAKEIWVYAGWHGIEGPVLIGKLHSEHIKGKEVFSFEYERTWLKTSYAMMLDPELLLFEGRQYLREGKENFGLFMDSSPDRWGRTLMKRREALKAREEGRRQVPLFESDYLLGVYDEHRMGALRFKLAGEGAFLNNDLQMAAPPMTSLRELEQVSLKIEADDVTEDPEYEKWLNMLMAPGSSLGGTRPKAGVLDADGQLWIAKFPSRNDDKDMGRWEHIVWLLAGKAGIVMAPSMLKRYSSQYHTFITQRFDRRGAQRRHFASAMTLLGHTDGFDHSEGASYLELADFIMKYGAEPDNDLEQLWRRIVFNIAVSNTDDHLRNHGFILDDDGWSLSPAYDINANEYGGGLSLNISETDNVLEFGLALEVAAYFRITNTKAAKILAEVKKAVSAWEAVAKEAGTTRAEREQMEGAFRF